MEIYRLMQNEEALKLFRKGRRNNIAGNILGIPAGFFVGWELYNSLNSDREANKTVLIVSSIGTVFSIVLNGIGIR